MALAGCASSPLSERALGQPFPLASDATGDGLAQIAFSADKKYESESGVPLEGDPLICGPKGAFRINDQGPRKDRISVKASEEIAVTSVIQWVNTGWRKTCWPFVAFTPTFDASYVVVNERIGGKGFAAMWTGVALQKCEVSVFRETATGFERVATRKSSLSTCKLSE